MDILTQVADEVAVAVLKVLEETGDESIIEDVKKVIGASSQTLEEAYMTSVRVRRAEKRAYALIAQKRASAGL